MTMGTQDLEVWFLTGSQELYGEDVLRQVAEQSQQVAAGLSASPDVTVRLVWKPVVKSSEEIRKVCLEATADERCVGVIAWMHTFSPAKMWIAGLDALRKPLLHLHTQANESLPWSEIDMDFMNLNQAAHGDREFGYMQTRMRLDRKTVVGHTNDPEVGRRVGTWMQAAVGRQTSRTLKLARFGDNMRNVGVTEGDKTEAQIRFGIEINTWGVNDLVDRVDAVGDGDVDALVEEYEATYAVAPELRRGGERADSLRYAGRIELGLRSFLVEGGFSAFTTNFEDLGGLRQLPGLAVQRLMADGYGFGGEGDWKTAALLRVLKSMGEGRDGGTSFMEDYTYHLGPGPQRVLGAHMLEVCPTLTGSTPRCEVHPLGIGGREDPVRLVFSADPGPAVVVGLLDLGDRFRLVANVIDVVEPDAPLPKLPVAHAVWSPRPSLPTSAEAWMLAGGPHHTVLTASVTLEAIADFASMSGTELVVIDESTTSGQFQKELRWNAAYYRLAGGL